MFDRLIESDSIGADFKPRRRYFIVSTVVVGLLFISAVVISLYATDIGLGNDTFELSAIVAPVQPPAEAPEPPRPESRQQLAITQSTDRTMRIIKQAPIDESPLSAPPISTQPNRYQSLTKDPVDIGPVDTNGSGPIGISPESGSASATEPSSIQRTVSAVEQPPKVDTAPPAPIRPKSLGVVNGIAIVLPKPPYPPAAVAVNAQGKVDVQIAIDEHGNVVSARAVDGPSLLRQVSEQAALRAKFKPTYLSNVPVKATGVIIYNFTGN